jgi:hypothetical protein
VATQDCFPAICPSKTATLYSPVMPLEVRHEMGAECPIIFTYRTTPSCAWSQVIHSSTNIGHHQGAKRAPKWPFR